MKTLSLLFFTTLFLCQVAFSQDIVKTTWWERTFNKKKIYNDFKKTMQILRDKDSLNVAMLEHIGQGIVSELEKAGRITDAKNFQNLMVKEIQRHRAKMDTNVKVIEANTLYYNKVEDVIKSPKDIKKKNLNIVNGFLENIKPIDNINILLAQSMALLKSFEQNNKENLFAQLDDRHYRVNNYDLNGEARGEIRSLCEDILRSIEGKRVIASSEISRVIMDKPNLLKGIIVVDIRSIGYADPRNTEEHNCELSKQRAMGVLNAIKAYLNELIKEYSKKEPSIHFEIMELDCVNNNDTSCQEPINEDCIREKMKNVFKNSKTNQVKVVFFGKGMGETSLPDGVREGDYNNRRITRTHCNVYYLPIN